MPLSYQRPNWRTVIFTVTIDIICLLIVGIPVVMINFVVVPFQRGFFCDDESLMHPYKENTVPTWAIGFVSILLPLICIFIGEGNRLTKDRKGCLPDRQLGIPFIIYVYINAIFPFLFSLLATLLTTDFAKVLIGRLRPHFLTLCDPDWSQVNCSGYRYVEDVVCRSTDEAALREARISFPSGHASFGTCGMLYLMIYTQKRFTWRKLLLLRPLLQLATFYVVFYVALSRISDYMHHWSDVLGGAIIGFIIGFAVIRFSTDLLRTPNRINVSNEILCASESRATLQTVNSYTLENTDASQLKDV